MPADITHEQNDNYGLEPVVCEPCHALSDILRMRTVPALRELATLYGVKGVRSLKKEDLIRCIQEAMLTKEQLERILFTLGRTSWKFFQLAAAAGTYVIKGSKWQLYLALQEYVLIQAFTDGDKVTCVVPEEVRSIYQSLLGDGFQARKERDELIHSYACAAVNLYGVIQQNDLIALFNSQNGRKLSLEELHTVFGRHAVRAYGYARWKDYLINEGFWVNSDEDMLDLLDQISKVPRYIPAKRELIRYANPDYYEDTTYSRFLEYYLRTDAEMDEDTIAEVMQQVHDAIVLQAEMPTILDLLADYGVPMEQDELQIVAELIMEMASNTRLWFLNGHTQWELANMCEREQRRIESRAEKRVKIGRNDLCPCGSGKKYKKCCGR